MLLNIKSACGGRFLLMLFLHRAVRLCRGFVSVEAKSLHKHAGIVCSRHQPNRAKGSREELPCGVKGQRPLGHSCHTSPSARSQPTTSICHADSSAAGVRMAEISP